MYMEYSLLALCRYLIYIFKQKEEDRFVVKNADPLELIFEIVGNYSNSIIIYLLLIIKCGFIETGCVIDFEVLFIIL